MSLIKKWSLISTEDVSPSSWINVYKHKVELPDKTIIDDYFVTDFGSVSMVLPFTIENKIVLVKQYKHGLGQIVIELPAGQQKKTSAEETAIEELEEETGIKTTIDNLISLGMVCNNPTKTNHITQGFLALNLKFNSAPSLDVTEQIEVLQLYPKDVIKMVFSGEIWVADSVAFIMKAYIIYPNLFK